MNPALLPLFVAIPLIGVATTVLWRQPLVERVLMIAVPAATGVVGLALLADRDDHPILVHQVGGYLPGFAIPFVCDAATALMLTVTGLATATAAAYLILTGEDRYRFVPPLVLMLVAGVNGALLTADLFNLFVWIEVMLLPSYALIAVTGAWTRLQVGRTFLLVNLLTSTLLLIGIALVYAVTGTVNLGALAGAAIGNPSAALAGALLLFALAVKAAVVPMHSWLGRTYPGTSAGIMALFAAVHTKVALYAMYRVYVVLYGGTPAPWATVLGVLVVATMVLGAFGTLGERRIRSAMSWQMVSGVGHILLGPLVLSATALGAGLFYLVHHVVSMGAVLLVAGAIETTYGSGRFDRLRGLMRREKVAAALMALGLLSLVGLPPMSGLWGKVGLVWTIVPTGGRWAWVLIVAIVLASFVSLMAVQRLWGEVMWGPPMETYRPDHAATGRAPKVPLTDDVRIPRRLLLPGGFLIAVSIGLFVVAGPAVDAAAAAGRAMLDVAGFAQAVLR